MTTDYQSLLKLAVRFVGIRPRTTQEVLVYLRKKTLDLALVNQLIQKLTDLKLLNDSEFANWYVDSRSRTNPRSSKLLVLELKRKGLTISPESLRLDDLYLAKIALERKQKSWPSLSAKNYQAKAIRFLASRGFSWEVIERVVKKEYNE